MSFRIEKVNKLIKQEIGKIILSEVTFPQNVLVTVISAKVSKDLRYADVFISVLPSGRYKEIEEFLNQEIYELQRMLNKRLSMKPLPRIRFKEDKGGENIGKIDMLIKKSKEKESF